MSRKRHTPVQIVRKVKAINEDLTAGMSHQQAAVRAGISEQTLRRWLRDYSESADAIVVRLKHLQGENSRLRKTVWKLEQDNHVLSEAARGNY
jgi:putative transposase